MLFNTSQKRMSNSIERELYSTSQKDLRQWGHEIYLLPILCEPVGPYAEDPTGKELHKFTVLMNYSIIKGLVITW